MEGCEESGVSLSGEIKRQQVRQQRAALPIRPGLKLGAVQVCSERLSPLGSDLALPSVSDIAEVS